VTIRAFFKVEKIIHSIESGASYAILYGIGDGPIEVHKDCTPWFEPLSYDRALTIELTELLELIQRMAPEICDLVKRLKPLNQVQNDA
jgi:hypothetical protein